VSGTIDKIKGRAKEAVGVVTNNRRLYAGISGNLMSLGTGKVKKAVDRILDKVKR
jgi:uncharacterized protein YjbJ (UPF0337 family)